MKIIVSSLIFLLSVSITGQAQILNKLKQKAESAVNKAATSKSQNNERQAPDNNQGSSSDNNQAPETSTQPTTTSSSTTNNNKMEYPFIMISDAKFYFADKPFTNSNDWAKTSFTSQDFIYGRMELGGKTLNDVFKISAEPTKGFHYLNYGILITPKDKSKIKYAQSIENTVYNLSRPILIKENEMNNTWLNFDVLADPSKINTLEGPTTMPETINELKFAAGMDYHTCKNNIQKIFPANGEYIVQLVLWNYSYDDWGVPLESEKNLVALGTFDYNFNAKDAATLIDNSTKRTDAIEMSKKMKTKLHKLPDWWSKIYKSNEAMLSAAKLTPMIKSYISQWGLTYITHRIYPYSNTGWTLFTDSQTGFPVSRRSNAEIYLLYKDKDGTCHIASVTLDEKYAGGGTYGSPYLMGLWNDEFIDCSAIK